MKKYLIGMLLGASFTLIPVALANLAMPLTFSDVNSNDWFYQPISYLSSEGIIGGYNDGTFRPNNFVNRAEAAQMIYKTYGSLDVRDEVNSLKLQVEALQAKINTLNMPGTCYSNSKWYQTGQQDPVTSCTCQSNGTMSCPSAS